jgi:hypothetical protein
MTLAEVIQAHARALPPALQREALDFIAWLEARYGISAPAAAGPSLSSTEDFIARHAGALSDDFPDDIDDSDLGEDAARESLE